MVLLKRREGSLTNAFAQREIASTVAAGSASSGHVKRQRGGGDNSYAPRSSSSVTTLDAAAFVVVEEQQQQQQQQQEAGPSHASCSYYRRSSSEQTRTSHRGMARESSSRSSRGNMATTLLQEFSGRTTGGSLNEQTVKGVERITTGKRSQGTRTRKYLRPGQLAKLVDDHKRSLVPSCTTFGRKRVGLGDNTHNSVVDKSLSVVVVAALDNGGGGNTVISSPAPTLRSYGPACPQRKKLLAPKTPLTPAAQLIVMRSPLRVDDDSRESLPESLLEALPVELLVHIVCRLHHDQLKPVFHVCRRLRQAVLIARQWHFNFTTPDHERQKSLGLFTPRRAQHWPPSSAYEAPGGQQTTRPATPQAPRHGPKPAQARIPLAEMRQIVAPLFQDPGSQQAAGNKPPGLPRPQFRAVASHRALFNEEELCQAVAQTL